MDSSGRSQCVCVCVCVSVSVCSWLSHVRLFATLWTVALQAPLPGDFPSKNTGVGSHFLLQGFPSQPRKAAQHSTIYRTAPSMTKNCFGPKCPNAEKPYCRLFFFPVSPLDMCLSNWSKWVSESRSVVSNSLRPHGLYSPWDSPGQNTGVSSLSLLQGISPTQGSNQGLPHCRRILYQLSHKGSSFEVQSSNSLRKRSISQLVFPYLLHLRSLFRHFTP